MLYEDIFHFRVFIIYPVLRGEYMNKQILSSGLFFLLCPSFGIPKNTEQSVSQTGCVQVVFILPNSVPFFTARIYLIHGHNKLQFIHI
jgi:hypothetical protein